MFVFHQTQSQVIQLIKPAKGDVWPAFTLQRIQWNSTNIDNIKIESSLDSGRTWTTIISSYPASAEYYDWEVPNKVSDSCFIRVTDIANPGTLSTNYPANPFIIPKPGLTIDSLPTVVYGRSVLPIPWTHSGIKKVNVYISFTGRSQFVKIADTVSANNGFFIWITKDTTAANCFVRIEDATNNTLSDTSDRAFAIQPLPQASEIKFKGGKYDGHTSTSNLSRMLRTLSPNTKDSLIGSTSYTIKWETRNIDLVKLEYTIDNGSNWLTIQSAIPASAGYYDWKVPNAPTTQGRIRITDVSDSTFFDSSDSLFTIRKKELKLLYPNESLKLYRGSVWPISWSSMGVTKLRLKFLPSALIADSLSAGNEMYNWVAGSMPDSFRVVIQDMEDSTLADTSAFLKAVALPGFTSTKYRGGKFDGHSALSNLASSIQIISPSQKMIFSAGSKLTLQWRSVNVDNMSLWLSTDSLKSWVLREAAITASTGSYTMRLPNTTASHCSIKLVNNTDTLVYDMLDSAFSIIPKQLKNTTDTANWKVGQPKIISWESLGVDSLIISYKTSLTGGWTVLNKSYAANAEVFYWILPKVLDSVWIKLEDAADTSLAEVKGYFKKIVTQEIASNGTKFKGGRFDGHSFRSNVNKIIIRKPDANEVIVSGTVYSINWSTINVTDSVMLQFSVDSGKTWIQIGRVSATNGLYSWQVPVSVPPGGTIPGSISDPTVTESTDINSTNCLLRAVDPSNANEVVGISPKTFTIKAAVSRLKNELSFTKPNEMVWPGSSFQILKATSTSGKNIEYLLLSGSAAKISKDSLIAVKPGKITVGAFSAGDNNYLPSDTVKYTICVNPAKPVLTVKDGKNTFCAGDSAVISGPLGFSYKWNRGDTVQTVIAKSSSNLALQIAAEGCVSVASDTIKLVSDTVVKPIVEDTSACVGVSIASLKANAAAGNTLRWYGTNASGGTSSSSSPAPPTSNAGSYNYYVSQVNARGCESDRAKIIVTVHPLPAKPVITWNGTQLSTTAGYATYQWLFNNTLISGANTNSLQPSNSGIFKVRVTNAAACADTSDGYNVVFTALSNPVLDGKVIKLFPNPVKNNVILDLGNTPRKRVNIRMYNNAGAIIETLTTQQRNTTIGVTHLANGFYLLEIQSATDKVILSFIKH